jgi:hypothetical protein
MTVQQKDSIMDGIRQWILPIAMSVAGFFLSEIYSEMKEVTRAVQQMQVMDERQQGALNTLKFQVEENQRDIAELKKILETEY